MPMLMIYSHSSILFPEISEEHYNLVHYRVHIFNKILRLTITRIINLVVKI